MSTVNQRLIVPLILVAVVMLLLIPTMPQAALLLSIGVVACIGFVLVLGFVRLSTQQRVLAAAIFGVALVAAYLLTGALSMP